MNNFPCKIFAVRCQLGRGLHWVAVSHAVCTVQSGVIWQMKEQHCGLFSGKAISVATLSSLLGFSGVFGWFILCLICVRTSDVSFPVSLSGKHLTTAILTQCTTVIYQEVCKLDWISVLLDVVKDDLRCS